MARRTPTPTDPPATERVAKLADTPTTELPVVGPFDPATPVQVPVTGEIVKGNGSSGRDRTFAELAAIIEGAQTLQFEGQVLIELFSLLHEAKDQAAKRHHVDEALIAKGFNLWEGWLIQRGLKAVDR